MGDILISYDEGISSTGWSVWKTDSFEPTLLATGDVDYPTDDCLASKRRQLCHLRRSIRSRRHCIAQLAKLFVHLKLLPEGEVSVCPNQSVLAPNNAQARDFKKHPWFLAARLLAPVRSPETNESKYLLTPSQLWDVLRWYAHNRGYNVPWAGHLDESDEDTRKVGAARAMMDRHDRHTMAETCCAAAGIPDPLNPPPAISGGFVGKKFGKGKTGEVPAFPRDEILIPEVRQILEAHRETIGKLPAFVDYSFDDFINAIVSNWQKIPVSLLLKKKSGKLPAAQKAAENVQKVWLPRRYVGGLLFGQRIPRFNNRIISTCPKTDKKTPLKQCREFYEYRWAMLVNNIKVGNRVDETNKLLLDARQLDKTERDTLDAKMRSRGFLTRAELTAAVKECTGCEESNLDRMFIDTPEVEESLVLQPVEKYLASKKELAHYLFPVLPEKLQKNLRNALWRGKRFKIKTIRDKFKADAALTQKCDEAIEAYIREKAKQAESDDEQNNIVGLDGEASADTDETKKPNRRKQKPPTRDEVLEGWLSVRPAPLSGRAPYCWEILNQVRREVFGLDKDFKFAFDQPATDPRRYSQEKLKLERVTALPRLEKAEDKTAHGCLAGVEEVSPENLGIAKDEKAREADYQKWRADWIAKVNKKGEDLNRRRAEKYGEAWVRRQYETQELEKWLAKKSNNHLVRQRMLILDRLTQDIIADQKLCNGDPRRIGRIAVEVARDLVTFSGMTSKQRGGDDEGVMGSIRAQHRRVRAKLEHDLRNTKWEHQVGKLLWKAKIADDLDWRCPYTGIEYCRCDLASGKMDVDHIIPKSVRLTNSMYAVVITFKAINQLKGTSTARGFVKRAESERIKSIGELFEKKCRDCTAQSRPDGMPVNAQILSEKRFLELVDSLKTGKPVGDSDNPMFLRGTQRLHPDYKGRKLRKRYLKISEYTKDNDAFTSRQLTNTSYLNRLAQGVLLRRLPHLGEENVVSIPGQVTKALRDSSGWSLFSCLGHRDVCGEAATRQITYTDDEGRAIQKRIPAPKEELRKLTHLHHAVDACALALIAHWLPKHGTLWELLALGELTEKEKTEYETIVKQFALGELRTPLGRQTVMPRDLSEFLTCRRIDDAKANRSPDPERIYRLEAKRSPDAEDRMSRIRAQISRELAKKRVVQHIPVEHAGLPTDETIYRVITGINGHGKVVSLVRQQIEKQQHKVRELEKPFRECEAKLKAFDEQIQSIPDTKQRAIAKKERQPERKQLAETVKNAKEKYEAAKSLLETMTDFKTNSWRIKKVRIGSDAWKEITKRMEKVAGSSSDADGQTADDQNGDDGKENKKTKKPPKMLGEPDLDKDKLVFVYDVVPRPKLISLSRKGGKKIGSNFGIAILDNVANEQEKFVAIPWHKVWPRLYGPNPVNGEQPLIQRNGGKRPRLLRVGMRIRLSNIGKPEKEGIWMIRSAKASLKLTLSRVDFPQVKTDPKVWDNVSLISLGAQNIEVLPNTLTGIAEPAKR